MTFLNKWIIYDKVCKRARILLTFLKETLLICLLVKHEYALSTVTIHMLPVGLQHNTMFEIIEMNTNNKMKFPITQTVLCG